LRTYEQATDDKHENHSDSCEFVLQEPSDALYAKVDQHYRLYNNEDIEEGFEPPRTNKFFLQTSSIVHKFL
jgi:hypothetical protein